MSAKRPGKKAGHIPAAATADAINEDLGRRVKQLRGDRGWSREERASASGVSSSILSEIERQRANPTLSMTYRIARAFGPQGDVQFSVNLLECRRPG